MMRNKLRKILAGFLACGVLAASSVTSQAADTNSMAAQRGECILNSDAIIMEDDTQYYLTQDEVLNGGVFSEQELAMIDDEETILGGVNAPITVMLSGSSAGEEIQTTSAVGEVWCRSYAAYSSSDGVSVYVKLYVPWYYFANPKFTSMSGTVSVALGSKSKVKSFATTANAASTISTTVSTGMTASSGTKGTVVVAGTASGNNLQNGAGVFGTSYAITIPN